MPAAALAPDDQAALLHRVSTDPIFFAETILGHDLWGVPRQILSSIAKPHARVAVKACHSSSKTFSAAELVLWTPYAGGIAITTGPTDRQVRRLVWAEANAMYAKSRYPLGGRMLQKEFVIAPDTYALGLATDRGVNFQGFHARDGGFMLVVLDESPGVDPAVWTAIEGIRAGGDVRILALGNPDVPSGDFYNVFNAQRSNWTTFSIDAFETPNLEDELNRGHQLTLEDVLELPEYRWDYAPRPYLITRRYIREKYDEWGVNSPKWQSKVRGQFPDQSEDSLLSLRWLEEAQRREYNAKDHPIELDEWEAGIDVAGPGEDETVVCLRNGSHIHEMKWWGAPDPRGEVLAYLAPYQERIKTVKVDSIGIGYYFAKHLEDNGWRGKVAYVNVGESARTDKARKKFVNLKAELYWDLRLHFEGGEISGLLDDTTISQLASIRYEENHQGRTAIESKDTARARGVKSPDRAEAVMLAFAKMARPKLQAY